MNRMEIIRQYWENLTEDDRNLYGCFIEFLEDVNDECVHIKELHG